MAKKGKRHPFRNFVLWCMLLCGIGGIGYYVYSVFGTYTYKPVNEENLGVTKTEQAQSSKIINIALFGVDARHGETARSDAMIVLSVDGKRGKVKMSSLMRDAYVEIEDHGKTKLCHAYAYGGPECAIKAINQNYDLDITDYATVNFNQMAKLIDAIGGVEVDVSETEMKEANKFVWEYCMETGDKFQYIEKAGPQTLTGMQAVAYGRIRKGGTGGDTARTGRQQVVLEAMMQKVMDMSVLRYPALAAKLMPMVETSMTSGEILNLATTVMKGGKPQIEKETFPAAGDWQGKTTSGGMWVAAYDDALCVEKMHKFIYDDLTLAEQAEQAKQQEGTQKQPAETQKQPAGK
ncbi:LCP family protein [Acidaminobacterium chupaoyuni]